MGRFWAKCQFITGSTGSPFPLRSLASRLNRYVAYRHSPSGTFPPDVTTPVMAAACLQRVVIRMSSPANILGHRVRISPMNEKTIMNTTGNAPIAPNSPSASDVGTLFEKALRKAVPPTTGGKPAFRMATGNEALPQPRDVRIIDLPDGAKAEGASGEDMLAFKSDGETIVVKRDVAPRLFDHIEGIKAMAGPEMTMLEGRTERILSGDDTVPLQDLTELTAWLVDGKVVTYTAKDKDGQGIAVSKALTPEVFGKIEAMQRGTDQGFALRKDGARLSGDDLAQAEILGPDKQNGFIGLTLNGEKIHISKDITPDLYNQIVWEKEGYQREFYEQNRDTIETIRDRWDDWNGRDSIVSEKDLRKYAADENRTTEDRDAARFLLDNEGFFDHLDIKAHDNRPDGKISNNDLNAWLRPVAVTGKETSGFRDFLKANPKADDLSKDIAQKAGILRDNFDAIRDATGSGKHLTREDLQRFADENPQVSPDLKDAIAFWTEPGAFEQLETGTNPLGISPDGLLGTSDIDAWLKSGSPKTAQGAMQFLSEMVTTNLVGDVDVGALGKDILDNPQNHSVKEQAAVLHDLLAARQLILDGASAGMWADDYGKVTIANRARVHPDPAKVLADLDANIAKFDGNTAVAEYLNAGTSSGMSRLLQENPSLKEAMTGNYANVTSGKALDAAWDAHTKDGKTDRTAVLTEHLALATMYEEALGIEDGNGVRQGIEASGHAQDVKDHYRDALVSGTRLEELLKTGTAEEAMATYSTEVALYNATLDPEFTAPFDDAQVENFTRIARENIAQDATFDDLKKVLGVDGGDQLDEAKARQMIDAAIAANPAGVTNANGTVATTDQILTSLRGEWDLLRQGTKTVKELLPAQLNPSLQAASDKGRMHGVSGMFMAAITIAKGTQGAGKLTDRAIVDITTGSIATAALLTEGGTKGGKTALAEEKSKFRTEFQAMRGREPTLRDPEWAAFDKKLKVITDVETAAKGAGGVAGMAGGAYAIFDGVQALRRGDKVGGGITIASGSAGTAAGLASLLEASLPRLATQLASPLGTTATRLLGMLPAASGMLGMLAAGAGFLAMIPGLITEGKRQTSQNDFGDLLGTYLEKYEIDGVEGGTVMDVPMEEWPASD